MINFYLNNRAPVYKGTMHPSRFIDNIWTHILDSIDMQIDSKDPFSDLLHYWSHPRYGRHFGIDKLHPMGWRLKGVNFTKMYETNKSFIARLNKLCSYKL